MLNNLKYDLRGTYAEETLRANSSKYDRCSGKYCGSWAYETLFLSGGANVLDVVKHPILNESHPDATNNSRDKLNGEYDAGGNLHVMAKLKVTSKDASLEACNSKGLEDSVGNGPTWKHVTSNNLIHHLCRDWLISDGLKHTKRDGQSEC